MAKTVLITGASSGIGEETAKGLLAAGYTVYAGARRVDRMQPLAGAGARLLALDVTDDTSMTTAVETVLQEAGHIDVLVNNAGYGSYGALEEVPLDEGRRQFDVNIFGLARLIQLVLPTMRAQRSGRIVNVSSIGESSASPLAAGITPPSLQWKGSATRCGWSSIRSVSMSSSSSREQSSPSGTASRVTA